MEEKMEPKKKIGNVGVLDIRKATEESIASIGHIGNIGMLLYSPETAKFILRLNTGNIGSPVEVPTDAKLITGQEEISRDYFKNQKTPLSIVVIGGLTVHPDIPIEDIEKGLVELRVVGKILYPEHLAGVMGSKLRSIIGESHVYIQCNRLITDQLVLDENYLHTLDDASVLVVLGDLKLPKVIPTELLEQKIQRIQVFGEVTCREENAQTLFARLESKTGAPKMTIFPAGFELVEKSLLLNADLLESLSTRKLYCTDRVQIDRDVDAAMLDNGIESLIASDMVLCPVALKKVLSQKCDLLKTQVIFYEGELLLVEDEHTLLASSFDYMEDKVTIVVFDVLTISPDTEPKVLFDRLSKVHNLGVVRCTPDQMGVIQAKLGLKDGVLEDSTKVEAVGEDQDEDQDVGIGNIGHLSL